MPLDKIPLVFPGVWPPKNEMKPFCQFYYSSLPPEGSLEQSGKACAIWGIDIASSHSSPHTSVLTYVQNSLDGRYSLLFTQSHNGNEYWQTNSLPAVLHSLLIAGDCSNFNTSLAWSFNVFWSGDELIYRLLLVPMVQDCHVWRYVWQVEPVYWTGLQEVLLTVPSSSPAVHEEAP